MKAALIFLLLIGATWQFYSNYGDKFPWLPQATDLREDYTTIEDKQGRALSCKLLAKNQDFVVIERQTDRQAFLINLYDLSERSRRLFESKDDFNASIVEERLFEAAVASSFQVELQSVPALNHFRCGLTGQTQKTCSGNRMDEFRRLLRKHGIPFREVSLPTRPAGGNRVYLPDGVKTVPCVKIGNELLYSAREGKLKQLMADAYAIEVSMAN